MVKINSLDRQYKGLLIDILHNGAKKEGRNGVTYSVFGREIRHDMREGFPLLTTKKMYWNGIVGELLWFLSGSSDIRDLWKRNVSIWDGDWYKNYKNTTSEPYSLEEIKYAVTRQGHGLPDSMFDLGPIYGKQWRDWGSYTKRREVRIPRDLEKDRVVTETKYVDDVVAGFDQIKNLIDTLINNPDSRRMMVNAWNVGELDEMVLPPCHYGFQVWTRELTLEERVDIAQKKKPRLSQEALEKWSDLEDDSILLKELKEKRIPKRGISLLWNQRSVDTPLGLPFNIASYGLLLMMIADEVGMLPIELIGNLGDTHIYENQIDGVMEQIDRPMHPLPKVILEDGLYSHEADIHLENYESEDKINFPLSN